MIVLGYKRGGIMNYSEFEKMREGLRVVSKVHGSKIKMAKDKLERFSFFEDFFDEYVSNMNVLEFARIVRETLTEVNNGEPFVIILGEEIKRFFPSMIDETSPIDEICEKIRFPMDVIKDETKRPISFVKRTAKVSSVFVEPKDKSREPVELGIVFPGNPELSTIGNTETSFKYALSQIEYEYGQKASAEVANKIFKDAEKQFNLQRGQGME